MLEIENHLSHLPPVDIVVLSVQTNIFSIRIYEASPRGLRQRSFHPLFLLFHRLHLGFFVLEIANKISGDVACRASFRETVGYGRRGLLSVESFHRGLPSGWRGTPGSVYTIDTHSNTRHTEGLLTIRLDYPILLNRRNRAVRAEGGGTSSTGLFRRHRSLAGDDHVGTTVVQLVSFLTSRTHGRLGLETTTLRLR